MFLNIDWKGLLKAILKAALPFLLSGAIGVTHDATQNADYSGGDTNETMQSNK